MESSKIIWSEIREEDGHKEMFYVLAEGGPGEWHFFERSSWELRWYSIGPSERLIKKATVESERRQITNQNLNMRQVA